MTRRTELFQALEATPRDLTRTLRNLSPLARFTRIVPDQWSLADILHHLLSVEIRTLARLHRVAEEPVPIIPHILPDPTPYDLTVPFDDLLPRFTAARTQTLAYLQPLPTGIWARPAYFEDSQKTTFRALVQALVDHDTEQLNQIVLTKNALTKLIS
ncbi:MAG: DinB family protein [Anaerolineales bacterium]|nr:DinB family protein [Anaerolineales bacterium]